ncbi:hypothetical protein HA402_006246 [Bradysia odoriphaga]|nr:hypothetical protein HA402_006246 [Bradysia odoriphaga]
MIFIYLMGALAAILIVKFCLYKRKIMKYVGHLPCLPEIPVVGSGLYFIGKNTTEIMDMLCMVPYIMDTPCRFWLGPCLSLFLARPEDVQTVLLSPKCLDKLFVYRFMDDIKGLLTAPLHLWKPQRKLLNPTFNNKIMLSFIPIFNEKSQILVNVLGKKVGEKAFDISKHFLACTLEMVCTTTIGCDLEFQNDKNVEILEIMENQSALVANRMIKFWLYPQFIYQLTDGYKKFRHNAECMYDMSRSIRKLKEKEFNEKKYFENTEELKEDEFFSTPQIFVNELFKLNKKNLIGEELLDDHILTVLAAGNETSGAHNVTNVQEKAFQEIKDAHESQTSESDAETLAKLDYVEMCIKETLRLFPVGPFLGRENTEDIQLSNCIAPKGTMLIMSCHYLHRNKDVWGQNADMFDPDNFLPEKVASRHAYSFLPFSGGSRNCIGIKYAWISMKIMISAVLRQYKFSTHLRLEDIVTKFEVTLKVENRQFVTVERREKY